MYGDFRTCEACGKTKPSSQFWQGAKRCRMCVARASAKRRRQKTNEWKSRVKEEYGLSVGISKNRFGRERAEAHRKAQSTVPRTARDALSGAIAVYGVVAGPPGFLFLLLGAILFDVHPGLWGWLSVLVSGILALLLADNLAAPRNAAVTDVTAALLRERLKLAEAELLEYLRFYTTSDWRSMRARVIRRDGRICQRCGIAIRRARDITVDHIKPRSRFPQLALEISNLQVLCRSCNSSKGASVDDE
jgi:hypothetical protein